MKKYLFGSSTSNIPQQECDICGKMTNYKMLQMKKTLDGEILICNACMAKLSAQKSFNDVNTKAIDYDSRNAVTVEETIRDVGL